MVSHFYVLWVIKLSYVRIQTDKSANSSLRNQQICDTIIKMVFEGQEKGMGN